MWTLLILCTHQQDVVNFNAAQMTQGKNMKKNDQIGFLLLVGFTFIH